MKRQIKKQEAPISLRLRPELRKKALKVAERNGLSFHSVVNLFAAAGADIVASNLDRIHDPKAA